MSSPENAIYIVLKDAADAAAVENALKSADVQPTAYSVIRELKTIRVGNCESEIVPVGDAVKELDADIILQILARVDDAEDAATYPAARDAARAMTMEVVKILIANPSLNGAVCDLIIRPAFRGWTRVESAIYAASLLPVRINPTGKYE